LELPAVIVPPLTTGAPPAAPPPTVAPAFAEAVGTPRAPAVVVLLAPDFVSVGFAVVLGEELGIAAVAVDPGISATPEASGCAVVTLAACGSAVGLAPPPPGMASRITPTASNPPRTPTGISSRPRPGRAPVIWRISSVNFPACAGLTGDWTGVFVDM
jgi:hypothetical protein